MHWLLQLCGLIVTVTAFQEACDDAAALLQLPRGLPSSTGSKDANASMHHAGLRNVSHPEVAALDTFSAIGGMRSPQDETQAVPVLPLGELRHHRTTAKALLEAAVSLDILSQPQLVFCLATAICSLVLVGELASFQGFEHSRFFSSLLAAMSLVGTNLAEHANLRAGIGVLDLIYARFVMLAFTGVVLVRFHPRKPAALPGNPEQAIQMLLGTFSVSATSMLLCGGVHLAPGTFVLSGLATLSSFGAVLKQCILREQIEWDESLASVGLLLSVLPMLSAAAHSSQATLLGIVLGLLAAITLATSALVQRNLCGTVHHTVLLTWSGGVGLIMFSPVALIFPEEARVLWTLDWPHFACMFLYGSLSLASTTLLLKVANSSLGIKAEASYVLFAGIAAGCQYISDIVLLHSAFPFVVQTSFALVATFLTFSYLVSCRQIIRVEECMSMAGSLQFEPQRFSQRLSQEAENDM
ncbi:cof [Symbiodinium necroappetens]|uniref:Cof protein n=1 Tax=Symbiodinium necroappetens TaxID=1628268 RepID=A0A813B404_9DINO|nr:cof [Symbiodinium necroappetens]